MMSGQQAKNRTDDGEDDNNEPLQRSIATVGV
jgi:hypothetical protein